MQAEPWLERDKVMIDQLKTLGIERGKPFQPDTRMQQVLDAAIKEAKVWLDAGYEKLLLPYYDGGQWMLPADPELFKDVESFFQMPDSYPVDARGITYTFAFFNRTGSPQRSEREIVPITVLSNCSNLLHRCNQIDQAAAQPHRDNDLALAFTGMGRDHDISKTARRQHRTLEASWQRPGLTQH